MRKGFENGNFEGKEVVLRIRVPKGFDEDMERKVDEALADTLYNLGCELVDSKEYRDVTENKEILVNHVTLVRERLSEGETWADHFWVDAGKEPLVELFKAAVQDYLRTPGGFQDIEATCRDFNWGDAVMHVPMRFWEDQGIYYADDLNYLKDKGMVPSRIVGHYTFVVDQDEVLIPEDLLAQPSLDCMIALADDVKVVHEKTQRDSTAFCEKER